MFLKKGSGPRVVTLPDGTQMTRADLPPVGTTRWVARRKAAVVRGVESGLISIDEAIDRYGLSAEEYGSWVDLAGTHGLEALKTTRLQQYRGA
ncbi:DUF1153 domain-containing protein [Jannaschia sp. LMIT008]|uniref:CtrA inhibitor SciP n=1 Tax=Jannaschia maritima TaxID=3032585 RepID=UPI0028115344|nr:DUF1153 domain-containing protein [Jannaschia sp. LMIT008]